MEEEKSMEGQEIPKTHGYQTGVEFTKKIKPIGMVFFLAIFIIFLAICFSSGREPVKDYAPPHDSEYYAQSNETLEELRAELEENFFPYIDGVVDSEIENGKILVITEDASCIKVRSALLRYYDERLFEFAEQSGTE